MTPRSNWSYWRRVKRFVKFWGDFNKRIKKKDGVDQLRKRDQEKFKKILEEQRDQLVGNVEKALSGDVHLDPDDFPDEVDAASAEVGLAFIGRLRERERGLLNKITKALDKLGEGIYGECENCGEPISIKRLEARPVAQLCIDCKGEQERIERQNR